MRLLAVLGLLGTFLEPGGGDIGDDVPYIYISKSAPLAGSVRHWALTSWEKFESSTYVGR